MRNQDFYELTRSAQDHFIEAVLRRTVPKPIISRSSLLPIPWAWAGGSVGGLVVFCVLVGWGYGSLDNPLAFSPPWMLGLHAFVLSASLFAAFRAAALYLEARKAPFPYGRFVFPAGVIDSSRRHFRIQPMKELSQVEVVGERNVLLQFQDGSRAKFKARDAQAAQTAKERIVTARRQLLEAEIEDQDDLASLDPLLEPRFSNPLAPLGPYTPAVPRWRKFTPLVAVGVGALLAVLVGYIRNTLSERQMYAAAVQADTPEAYRAYMQQGGKRQDVPELRLPTAELKLLQQSNDLKALELYAQEHPESKIKAAIDSALRQGLLTALDEAKKKETFQSLDEFAKAHPSQDLVKAEVKSARKALMKRVLSNFADNHAAENYDELVPFFEKLLHHLAANGPTVEVRFHRILPDTVQRADETVRKDKHFLQSMLPSQYFDDEHAAKREQVIFEHLQERFEEAFNPDALKLTLGKHLTTAEELPNEPSVPTLFITHSTNMGRGIRNLNPDGTFVGVGFVFKAFFVVPHEQDMLTMKYSTWRPPDLLKLRKAKLTIPEVYLTMADVAFDNFDRRVVRWLFRPKKN